MESLVLSLSKDEPLHSWSDKYILARRSWLDELTTSGESKAHHAPVSTRFPKPLDTNDYLMLKIDSTGR